jgi:hypothetical protein
MLSLVPDKGEKVFLTTGDATCKMNGKFRFEWEKRGPYEKDIE